MCCDAACPVVNAHYEVSQITCKSYLKCLTKRFLFDMLMYNQTIIYTYIHTYKQNENNIDTISNYLEKK